MKAIGRWFWSPPRENENWAQTLVRVLGNIFRSLMTLAVATAAVFAGSSYLNNREYEQQIAKARLVHVTAIMRTEQLDNGCTPAFPLAIIVENSSDQALMRMDIGVSARHRGQSTNILAYNQRSIGWDHIVPPDHELSFCYRLRGNHDVNAVYSADPTYHTVELQPVESWMLVETQAARMGTATP